MAVSRSASAAATSASRLMRAISGRPMLEMYSFLSRTSLMVNEMTSRPILLMSAAQVAFHHEAYQRLAILIRLGQELLGRGLNRFGVGLHFDLRDGFHRDCDA